MTIEQIYSQAEDARYAGDSFDIAICGFAELAAAGRWEDAGRVADRVVREWERYRARWPEFTASYALAGVL